MIRSLRGAASIVTRSGGAAAINLRRAAAIARRSAGAAAIGRAEPELEWRADQIDFAVASTIDRLYVRLIRPRRGVEELSRRLEAQVEILDELGQGLTPEAATELEARKGHVTWLLNELRRGL